MNEREEIVKFLNDEAAKAVKGSEFGLDEHYFGIAAEMIEEYEARLKTLQDNLNYPMNPETSIALFGDCKDRHYIDGKWVVVS